MVVLAAAVLTKAGKPLLSRQFLGLPRSRLESLLSSFPRLVPPTAEHTVLEASGVRYLYLPQDTLYVILITNTISNILLDLNTLALVSRLLIDCATGGRGGSVTEADIEKSAFQILSAWDEVITLGWREHVNLQQVRSVLEMESHEEKIQDIIARNKEQEAKEELKRRAKQLEMQRREMTKRGQNPYSSNASSGFSNVPSPTSYDQRPAANYSQVEADRQQAPSSRVGGGGFKTKGMQLGSKKVGRDQDVLNAALGGLTVDDDGGRYSQPAEREPVVEVVQARAPVGLAKEENPFGHVEVADVHLILRESLSLTLPRDGGLTSLSLKGDLDLILASPALSNLVLTLPPPATYINMLGGKGNEIQFKTHPNVDKAAWAERGEIRLKEGKKGFPVGQALGVLKWRGTGKDEGGVPISINCWPTISQNLVTINLEYELESGHSALKSLSNLTITIPLPGSSAEPQVSEEPSTGHTEWNRATNEFVWSVGDVGGEQEGSGTLEFTVEGEDMEDFFPVKVDFISQVGICGVQVLSVQNATDNSPVEFSIDSLLSTDEYLVV